MGIIHPLIFRQKRSSQLNIADSFVATYHKYVVEPPGCYLVELGEVCRKF